MPQKKDYKNPFFAEKATIASGQTTPANRVECGNFTPLAIFTPANWTECDITFICSFANGNNSFIDGNQTDLDGVALVSVHALPSARIPLDPAIFGTTNILKPICSIPQVNDVDLYFVGAPLYTIES